VHHRVTTPLPQILYDDQVDKLLEATQSLRQGQKPDARPHLLVSLLLQTGIKKGECMAIQLNHIDLSDPAAPVLYVRYDNPRMRHKERKLRLSADLVPILNEYLEKYQPREKLFECTARNLEYVLRHASQVAGLPESVSFEALRMTCAVWDYKAGMASEKLRKKLGLSTISWRDTSEKLKKLAAPPL
jgi:integrase/recombinase XerD